jgi:hypothetical protein
MKLNFIFKSSIILAATFVDVNYFLRNLLRNRTNPAPTTEASRTLRNQSGIRRGGAATQRKLKSNEVSKKMRQGKEKIPLRRANVQG